MRFGYCGEYNGSQACDIVIRIEKDRYMRRLATLDQFMKIPAKSQVTTKVKDFPIVDYLVNIARRILDLRLVFSFASLASLPRPASPVVECESSRAAFFRVFNVYLPANCDFNRKI